MGVFTCITGVSGSGKSTLINETPYPAAAVALNKASTLKPAAHKEINGLNHLDKCIDINQSPIGRTPRSNPATYTGIFTPIRELFAGTQEARSRVIPWRFSLMLKAVDARPVRVMVSPRLKCTSYLISMCPVMSVRASAQPRNWILFLKAKIFIRF